MALHWQQASTNSCAGNRWRSACAAFSSTEMRVLWAIWIPSKVCSWLAILMTLAPGSSNYTSEDENVRIPRGLRRAELGFKASLALCQLAAHCTAEHLFLPATWAPHEDDATSNLPLLESPRKLLTIHLARLERCLSSHQPGGCKLGRV